MLAFEVEYLMGRVLAATHYRRQEVEWPPHPSRLFSALVAAYEECKLDEDARLALQWLETLAEPSIYANPPILSESEARDVHEIYVPINDSNEQMKKTSGKVTRFPLFSDGIGLRRDRRGRWFPAFTPTDPHVFFIWPDASNMHTTALQNIAENVTYLGHSMSPVRVRVNDSPPAPTLKPDPNGRLRLRTTGKGRLRHLEEIYELRTKNTTIQPSLGPVRTYSVVTEPQTHCPASIYQNVYVFRLTQGVTLSPEIAAKLSSTVRKAILELYPDPIPDIISGHDPLGNPCTKPHLAVTPLLDAGHMFADGHVMGFALWLPQISNDVIDSLETAIAGLKSLTMGRLGRWNIQYVSSSSGGRRTRGLSPYTYTQEHDTWASITPVIFGKFPKKSQTGPGRDGGKVVAELCDWIGLPRPVEARIGPASAFSGIPMASEFVPPEKFAERLRMHVWLRFGEPVRGPVLVGAGQYSGFGLCRPWGLQ
jgi:CRISPR-associated protein Csb2